MIDFALAPNASLVALRGELEAMRASPMPAVREAAALYLAGLGAYAHARNTGDARLVDVAARLLQSAAERSLAARARQLEALRVAGKREARVAAVLAQLVDEARTQLPRAPVRVDVEPETSELPAP
jgi:hypothetical protein